MEKQTKEKKTVVSQKDLQDLRGILNQQMEQGMFMEQLIC